MPVPNAHPRRVTIRTLGLGLSALVAAGALASTPSPTTGWNQGAAEGTLWQLLNGARVNNGMAPLQSHGTLVSLARWRSSDMLQRNYFSHTIAGCGCLVYAYYDSNGVAYDWAGENIGWNSGRTDAESPVRVHEQFMGSPGHRVNVLDRRFTHGGVGAAAADNREFLGHVQNTRMYTELFLQSPSAPPPAPAPAPAPAAPAPAPPSGGSGGGGGGSGGGGGGGSGGGGAAAPAPAAAAPSATPAPKAKVVSVDAPRRPTSSTGLDGVATRVSGSDRPDPVTARLMIEDRSADSMARRPITTSDDAAPMALEVKAPPPAEPGLIETIVGAVIGFLFG